MGKLITLSGPRGCGKSAVVHQLAERGIHPIAPYTTRALRPDEIEGRDYRHVSSATFDRIAHRRPMFDVLELGSNKYGTPVADFQDVLEEEGALRSINLADRTALNLRSQFGLGVTAVALLPRRWEDIRLQMQMAGIDEEKINERISAEPTDLHLLPQFDEIVVNTYGELGNTVQHIVDLAGRLLGRELAVPQPAYP